MIRESSGVRTPEAFDSAKITEEEQRIQAATQLGELVDRLLLANSEDMHRREDGDYCAFQKIRDINNYLSVFVASTVAQDEDGEHSGQTTKSVTLVKTQDSRTDGTIVYTVTGNEATWRQEEDDGTLIGDVQPLMLDDIGDLEKVFGSHAAEDQFVA